MPVLFELQGLRPAPFRDTSIAHGIHPNTLITEIRAYRPLVALLMRRPEQFGTDDFLRRSTVDRFTVDMTSQARAGYKALPPVLPAY